MSREEEMLNAILDMEDESADVVYERIPSANAEASQVYSVRLPVARIEALRRVAAARGERPTAFMRNVVLRELDRIELAQGTHASGSFGVLTVLASGDHAQALYRKVVVSNGSTFDVVRGRVDLFSESYRGG